MMRSRTRMGWPNQTVSRADPVPAVVYPPPAVAAPVQVEVRIACQQVQHGGGERGSKGGIQYEDARVGLDSPCRCPRRPRLVQPDEVRSVVRDDRAAVLGRVKELIWIAGALARSLGHRYVVPRDTQVVSDLERNVLVQVEAHRRHYRILNSRKRSTASRWRT